MGAVCFLSLWFRPEMEDTYEIASALKLTAQLMELHGENAFKVRSLTNAAFRLDKTGVNLSGLSVEELTEIEGIGKGIAQKIAELRDTDMTDELADLLARTPEGVIQMLKIKGIGPKKVGQLWKELNVESVGELLYACHENRLVTLKGFGEKTQETVKKNIEFLQANSGKAHFATAEVHAARIVEALKKYYETELISVTGALRRNCEIIEEIEILVGAEPRQVTEEISSPVKVRLIHCSPEMFYGKLFETTGSIEFLDEIKVTSGKQYASEEEIFQEIKIAFIPPEAREKNVSASFTQGKALIRFEDLKGTLHNHSTWSDGIHSLKEMALFAKEIGLEYLGICDHSRTAVYANGLSIERVIQQHDEMDALNKQLAPFRILKGIESDILGDGSLDYPEEILKTFDLVVASVHQNLKMDEAKATSRLIKAVENPYTTILGHMTGRLLLSRPGYPVDHKKVIDACAANGVVMELNSHPYRLDIDWRWIPYCLEKGVMISINPDAHEKEGFYDMRYGVAVARKGLLTAEHCLNAKGLNDLMNIL
jgi:DNA polymerase (family X)